MTSPTSTIHYASISSLFDHIQSLHCPIVIICDENVANHYKSTILDNLHPIINEKTLLTIPSGEQFKSRETLNYLQDALLNLQCTSNTVLVGIGGGVVLDIVGFLASTFHRGVPFIAIPTSLLAMVDAAVGGKNGINIHNVKNAIGTIYFPKSIWVDVEFLQTLPTRTYLEGFAEIIKHALIYSPELLDYLMLYKQQLINKSQEHLQELIKKNNQIKNTIVASDVESQSLRNILNFGHTFGHALESFYHIPHGHAVSVGMVLETQLSINTEGSLYILKTLQEALKSFDLPTSIQELRSKNVITTPLKPKDILTLMLQDKKNLSQHRPKIVSLKNIGQPDACDGSFCKEVDPAMILAILSGNC